MEENTERFARVYAIEVAQAIRGQIQLGVLWSLGGHELHAVTRDGKPGLGFQARILPFGKKGNRLEQARRMQVDVLLNAADLYDVLVTVETRGQVSVHYAAVDVYAEDLNRLLLALDYNGPAVLNPRLVPTSEEVGA